MGKIETLEIEAKELEEGITVMDLFTMSGLTRTRGEAKRLILGKGARVNGFLETNHLKVLNITDTIKGRIRLKAGNSKEKMIVAVISGEEVKVKEEVEPTFKGFK